MRSNKFNDERALFELDNIIIIGSDRRPETISKEKLFGSDRAYVTSGREGAEGADRPGRQSGSRGQQLKIGR